MASATNKKTALANPTRGTLPPMRKATPEPRRVGRYSRRAVNHEIERAIGMCARGTAKELAHALRLGPPDLTHRIGGRTAWTIEQLGVVADVLAEAGLPIEDGWPLKPLVPRKKDI